MVKTLTRVLPTRVVAVVARENVMGETVDLALINKILSYIYEKKGSVTLTELVEKIGMSYTTASKYIAIMESVNLLKVETVGRKKQISITEKGIEYLMLYSRLVSLLKTR